MCLTLHVLSFTADLTRFPSGVPLKKKKTKQKQNTSLSKLPRLLDEEGPGQVGLLHRRSHLAVPHAHRRLWEVVAQLQNTGVCYPHGPRGTVTNPVCSGGVNFMCRVRTFPPPPHFKKGMFLFTLSRVPARRMPTCCILLEVATDLLQMRKNKQKNIRRKYQKSIWSKMLLDILKIFLKLKLHWFID